MAVIFVIFPHIIIHPQGEFRDECSQITSLFPSPKIHKETTSKEESEGNNAQVTEGGLTKAFSSLIIIIKDPEQNKPRALYTYTD
jgi:hypothetical protein